VGYFSRLLETILISAEALATSAAGPIFRSVKKGGAVAGRLPAQ
jgi:hypothetical protein